MFPVWNVVLLMQLHYMMMDMDTALAVTTTTLTTIHLIP